MRMHYDKPVYWSLPDDGASIRCKSCGIIFKCSEVILTQIPKDDSRQVLCKECVDDDWLELATNLGMFPD
jgi:hypothetical protein